MQGRSKEAFRHNYQRLVDEAARINSLPRENRGKERARRLPPLAERVIAAGENNSILSLVGSMARVQLAQGASVRPTARAYIEVARSAIKSRK